MEETQILGTFDGENMVGKDGKIYPVNANYASKSKLIDGDELKLIVDDNGSFIYKKIGQITTKKNRAIVRKIENKYFALTPEGKEYRILSATGTYFKLKTDDEVIILTPMDHDSAWATVENVIRILKDDDEKELEL